MRVKSESEVVQSCQHLAKLLRRLLTRAIQFLYLPKTDPLSYSFNTCWLRIYYMLASVSEISDGFASRKPHSEKETQALEWDGCGFVAWFCHLLTVSFHQVMSSLFLYTLAFTKITTKNVTIMSISSRAREKEAIAPFLWWLQGGIPKLTTNLGSQGPESMKYFLRNTVKYVIDMKGIRVTQLYIFIRFHS